MLECISSKKIVKNTDEAIFGTLSASTDPEKILMVKLIVVREIGFLLEINWHSCE